MTPERWARIDEVFGAAMEQPEDERTTFIAQACAGDEQLRRDVERLLAEERNPSFRSPVAASELAPNTVLGRYRVEAKLGQGGMGAVYKAQDTLLGRSVALKILPGWRFADAESRGRLVREARAACALNHPNIVTVFDVGCESGIDFIAMEYVAGKPLDALIAGRALPLEITLRYGAEIADGLGAAHRAGIIHRDIKPANILVTETGHVKILDFGVAKTLSATATATATGVVMGTASYMSPEQAEGGPVDARSDIYSFGAVLYEMATGRRAAPVQRKAAAPAGLEHVVSQCLRRDPARRFQHMDDVKIALEDIARAPESARPRRRLLASGFAVLAVVAAATTWFTTRPATEKAPILTQLTTDTGLTYQPAVSPDGNLIAYSSDRGGGKLDIWVQHVPRGEPIRLTHDAGNNWEPSFSPDGSTIAFVSDREGFNLKGGGIYLVPILGGEAKKIADLGRRPRFSPDGKWIAYWAGDPTSIGWTYIVPATGGSPQPILPGILTRSPVWTPDSRHLLCLRGSNHEWLVTSIDGGQPAVTDVAAEFRKANLGGGEWGLIWPAEWIPGTHEVLISAQAGDSYNLWTVSLSPRTWKAQGLRRLTFGTGPEVQPACTAAGRVVFSNTTRDLDIWSLPVDANGGKVLGNLQQLTRGAAEDNSPSVSMDGKRMVFVSDRTGKWLVWTKDLETGKESMLTMDTSARPVISPDGATVAYLAPGAGGSVHVVPFTGGTPRKTGRCFDIKGWMPDGRRVLCQSWAPTGLETRVEALDVSTGGKTVLVEHPALEIWANSLSPEGAWISFGAQKKEQNQQFVAPLSGTPPPESAWIPSRGIRWSPDGNRMWDREGFRILTQRLDPQTKRMIGGREAVYELPAGNSFTNVGNPGQIGFSVARDKLVFTLGKLSGNVWMAEWRK